MSARDRMEKLGNTAFQQALKVIVTVKQLLKVRLFYRNYMKVIHLMVGKNV